MENNDFSQIDFSEVKLRKSLVRAYVVLLRRGAHSKPSENIEQGTEEQEIALSEEAQEEKLPAEVQYYQERMF